MFRSGRLLPCVLLCMSSILVPGAEKRAVASPSIKPAGPYSPGVIVGDFLYVSGQGAKNAEGQIASDSDAQLRQCFENVKAIVTAAGLTMDNVVYTQVYLTDWADEGPLNRVW